MKNNNKEKRASRCWACEKKPSKRNPIDREAPDINGKWQWICRDCVINKGFKFYSI